MVFHDHSCWLMTIHDSRQFMRIFGGSYQVIMFHDFVALRLHMSSIGFTWGNLTSLGFTWVSLGKIGVT